MEALEKLDTYLEQVGGSVELVGSVGRMRMEALDKLDTHVYQGHSRVTNYPRQEPALWSHFGHSRSLKGHSRVTNYPYPDSPLTGGCGKSRTEAHTMSH